MGERGHLREDDPHHMRLMRDPNTIAAPHGCIEPNPATMSLYVLEIGGRDDLSETTAQESAREFRRVAGRGVPIYPAIAGFEDDERGLWEIAETRAFLRRWVALASITPERARETLHENGVRLLLLADAFGPPRRDS